MPNEEIKEAKELLTKLYLDLLSYKKDNKQQNEDKKEKDKQSFKNFTIIELINFLSNYINSLLEIKNNESLDEESDEKPLYKQYEELLIKAESDIRKHIKVSKYIYI
jgi:hypothetical protein